MAGGDRHPPDHEHDLASTTAFSTARRSAPSSPTCASAWRLGPEHAAGLTRTSSGGLLGLVALSYRGAPGRRALRRHLRMSNLEKAIGASTSPSPPNDSRATSLVPQLSRGRQPDDARAELQRHPQGTSRPGPPNTAAGTNHSCDRSSPFRIWTSSESLVPASCVRRPRPPGPMATCAPPLSSDGARPAGATGCTSGDRDGSPRERFGAGVVGGADEGSKATTAGLAAGSEVGVA